MAAPLKANQFHNIAVLYDHLLPAVRQRPEEGRQTPKPSTCVAHKVCNQQGATPQHAQRRPWVRTAGQPEVSQRAGLVAGPAGGKRPVWRKGQEGISTGPVTDQNSQSGHLRRWLAQTRAISGGWTHWCDHRWCHREPKQFAVAGVGRTRLHTSG